MSVSFSDFMERSSARSTTSPKEKLIARNVQGDATYGQAVVTPSNSNSKLKPTRSKQLHQGIIWRNADSKSDVLTLPSPSSSSIIWKNSPNTPTPKSLPAVTPRDDNILTEEHFPLSSSNSTRETHATIAVTAATCPPLFATDLVTLSPAPRRSNLSHVSLNKTAGSPKGSVAEAITTAAAAAAAATEVASATSTTTEGTPSKLALHITKNSTAVEQQASIIEALTEALHKERLKRTQVEETLRRSNVKGDDDVTTQAELRAAVQQLSGTVKELLTKQAKQSQVVVSLRAERRDLLSRLRLEEEGGLESTRPFSSTQKESIGYEEGSDEQVEGLRHRLALGAERARAAEVVSTVEHVANTLRSVRAAAVSRSNRDRERRGEACAAADEHVRITKSVAKARSQDLAELSLSRTTVRRLEAENMVERRNADKLRRRVASLEVDYMTQTKACETLIEEVQSQQDLLESVQDKANGVDESLFGAKQQLALVRHQNAELSGVVAKLTLELRHLRDRSERADANVAASRNAARYLEERTTNSIVRARRIRELVPEMLRKERLKHKAMRNLVTAHLKEFDTWMEAAKTRLIVACKGVLKSSPSSTINGNDNGNDNVSRGRTILPTAPSFLSAVDGNRMMSGMGLELVDSKSEEELRKEVRMMESRVKTARVMAAHNEAMRYAMSAKTASASKELAPSRSITKTARTTKNKNKNKTDNSQQRTTKKPRVPRQKRNTPRQSRQSKSRQSPFPPKVIDEGSYLDRHNNTVNKYHSFPPSMEEDEITVVDPLEAMRTDIFAAYRRCNWFGAVSKCFEARDRRRSGCIPLQEFRGILRRDIVVPVDALGDADIRRLFSLFQNEDGMLRSRDFCAWLIG